MSTTPTAAPSWAQTTLRWIAQKHPHLSAGFTQKSAEQQLARVLSRASYCKIECDDDGLTHAEYQAHLTTRTKAWDQQEHQLLTEWLDAGGYTAQKAKLDAVVAEMARDINDHVVLNDLEGLRQAEMSEDDLAREALLDEERAAMNDEFGQW